MPFHCLLRSLIHHIQVSVECRLIDMGDEKNAFYVVRKGDLIGIYRSFADCQAQAGFSPLDPAISVYKGYGLSKETESYLVSHGLQQASFSISASDVRDGLFGVLAVCPFQDAGESSQSALNTPSQPIKLENYVETQAAVDSACISNPSCKGRNEKHLTTGLIELPLSSQQDCDVLKNVKPLNHIHHSSASGPSSFLSNPQKRVIALKNYIEPQELVPPVNVNQSCIIEFDGASKGNPGLAGAGAVLRAIGGSEVWLLREGVGIATNNVAEYRSIILGLRTALNKGFKHVKVKGDSLLVCNQILGKWKTKNGNMANLCQQALHLKEQFLTFTIEHVARELNSAADAQANRAINLRDGQVEMEQSHA